MHTRMQIPPTSAALIPLPNPTVGDPEQEVMLTTKTPKATVGGLSPSKGYTLQIFELTGSGNILLARREFVSKCPGRACVLGVVKSAWHPFFPSPSSSLWARGGSRGRGLCVSL